MKSTIINLFISLFLLSIIACSDDEPTEVSYDYHAHIHSPNTDNKHVGDELNIDITFDSHTGETIHHINVRIYERDSGLEIYNAPAEAHIHATDGTYEYTDTLLLSSEAGVTGHSNWILEAKVWAHGEGDEETIETVEFHVHPHE